VAIVILAVSLLGQSSSPRKSRISAGVGTRGGGAGTDSSGARGSLWPQPAHAPLAVHRAGRSHGRQRPKRSSAAHGGASVAVNYLRQPSSTQSATAPSGAATGTSSSPTVPSGSASGSVSVPTPSSGGGTSGTSKTSGTSTASGSPRHPSKAPAFGASGALGPGHSGTG
jgi:hypothetical protein